ncbi:putative acetyltransferase [Candidatus Promineifilum breve]|uniref:Acetyltransferase n=1 Tax=Candidatus Promineifilum breve TaxID=1806508 RepID=A0A170PJ78_9CHLR|nr:GNAT family N-acetyltransferase [Candidatus Promineifilum breve]CUS05293.2 putative acetyltransferase [Candidatus Promineifilum breve]
MQLANSLTGEVGADGRARQATREDAAAIQRLLRMGGYVHVHVDWRTPGEWLGTPGFVVYEDGRPTREQRRNSRPGAAGITGCLAVAAEPLPAAWVRAAAVESTAAFNQAEAMLARLLPALDPAIEEIAWFLTDYWPLHWLERLGFVPVSEVLGYQKGDLAVPAFDAPPGLCLRPLLMEDLPALAAIEAAAFEPRWRHSAGDLYLAWRHSIGFDVALLDDEPVGFQFSTGGGGSAHLSRMTVRPDRQGLGIGAALLAGAIDNYRRQHISSLTLNTQTDNLASRRLYERFGYRLTGYSYPVWSYFPR